ncbi:transposase [Sphingosinicella sp. BN140058]|nr:transposase [Sphingosinicella sp. BN140058]
MTMSCDDAGTGGVQRFEVFTGAGRRRNWPSEVKASIVAESFSGRETVCAVARRHALSPSQLFTWRRALRKQFEHRGVTLPAVPAFVPAVVEAQPADAPVQTGKHSKKRRRSKGPAIELEIADVVVKIGRGADTGVIAAVIEALRATR